MRKCRKKGKVKQDKNTLAIKQSQDLYSSSSGIIDNILSHVLWAVCRDWNPHQVEEVNCVLPTSTETPDWVGPEGCWWWLPITSPPNEKNVHKLISWPLTPFLHPVFKNLSLKAFRALGLLSTSSPDSLLGTWNIHCMFLHPQPGLSRLALPGAGRWTQVCLVTHALYMFKELTHVLQTSVVMLLLLLLLSHFSRVWLCATP